LKHRLLPQSETIASNSPGDFFQKQRDIRTFQIEEPTARCWDWPLWYRDFYKLSYIAAICNLVRYEIWHVYV